MIESSSVVIGREHEAVNFTHALKFEEWIKGAGLRKKPAEILGLHPINGGFAPGNFIGAVRIGDCILQVHSKFQKPEMDYMAMFLCCADHSQVGGHMRNCLRCWPEESLIKVADARDFCGLIAAAFLRELNDLCAHRLRRNFVLDKANLMGKAKGKILSTENIRRNLSRGRAERVFCAYQSVSDDILENRILRAALERVAVYLSGKGLFRDEQGTLERWIRSCRSHLRGVSVVRVRGGDFMSARSRGAFSHYRRPLRLARAVLESTGFDLDGANGRVSGVVPFALDSAKLFELWAYLCLVQKYPNRQVKYNQNIAALNGGSVNVRPDFLIPADSEGSAVILDAKYKGPTPKSICDIQYQPDIYQVVSYSAHGGVRNQLKIPPEKVELGLLYPKVRDGDVEIVGEMDVSFHVPLSVWTIPCPAKSA